MITIRMKFVCKKLQPVGGEGGRGVELLFYETISVDLNDRNRTVS